MTHALEQTRTDTGNRKHPRGLARVACCLAAGLAVIVSGSLVSSTGPRASRPVVASVAPMSLAAVQSLYAQDLVARVNAERAARNSAEQPVPVLATDPGLTAAAQAWSAAARLHRPGARSFAHFLRSRPHGRADLRAGRQLR